MADTITPEEEPDLDAKVKAANAKLKAAKSHIGATTKTLEARKKALAEGKPLPYETLAAPKKQIGKTPKLGETDPALFSGKPQDQKVEVAAGLPILPPTIDRIVSPEMRKNLETVAAAGATPEAPDERNKIIAIAKSFANNPKFADKVIEKLNSGGFNEIQKERIRIAGNLLSHARASSDQPLEDQYDPNTSKTGWIRDLSGLGGDPIGGKSTGALTHFLDTAMLQETGVGAGKKLRLQLNRNLKTGEIVADIPRSVALAFDSHLNDLIRREGGSIITDIEPETREKIVQKAKDLAASDVYSAAMRGRNRTVYDPTDIDIEEIAKSDFPGLKAHFTRRHVRGEEGLTQGLYEAFNPTVQDLQEEGTLDYLLRSAIGPFEYYATKHKLIREGLQKEGAWEKYGNNAYLYAFSMFSPIGIDWAMDQMGITAEDEVRAYIEGWTFLEEGKEWSVALAGMVAEATGGDVESVKDRTRDSLGSYGLPIALYLLEPDAIYGAAIVGGRAARSLKARRSSAPILKAANSLRQSSQASEVGLATAISELEKIDVVAAKTAQLTILSKAANTVTEIDKAAAQLAPRLKEADDAEAALRVVIGDAPVDDLVEMARLGRENPDILPRLNEVAEKRAQVVGRAQSIQNQMAKSIQNTDSSIAQQKQAKTRLATLERQANRIMAKRVHAMAKNTKIREFLTAEDLLIRLRGELGAALEAKDKNKIVELTDKVKKAEISVRVRKKVLTDTQKKRVLTMRREARSIGSKLRKTRTAYHGDDVLDLLTQQRKKLVTTRARFGPTVAAAERRLEKAVRRIVAVDNKAASALKKTLKEKKIKGSPGRIITASNKRVRDFVRKEKLLAESVAANKWRETALEVATDFEAAAKKMREISGNQALFFAKTGPLGLKVTKAVDIFAGAVSHNELPNFVPGFASRGITETAKEGGRVVRVANATEEVVSDASILGRVFDATPDFLSVTKVTESAKNPLESIATTGNIQSMLHYAQRNGLGLDLGKKGLTGLQDTLRNMGIRVPASGKISNDVIKSINLAEANSRLRTIGPSILLNGKGIREKMVAQFGEEATEYALKRGGESAKLLRRTMDSGVPIRITPQQAIAIQVDFAEELARASRVLDPANRVEKLAKIFLDVKSHHPTMKKGALASASNIVKSIMKSHDPEYTRLGTASEDVFKIVRGAENITELGWEEYRLVLKQAGKGRDPLIQATLRYLDSTAKIILPDRKVSTINAGTKTIFQRAKRGILSDTRSHLPYSGGAEDVVIATHNPALLGLSRIWLPQGTSISDELAARLFGAAKGNLQKASTAEEFIKLQRQKTTQILSEGFAAAGADAARLMEGVDPTILQWINRSVDSRPGRVYAFATRSFLTGAVYDDMIGITKRSAMGIMSAEEAADINRVLTGAYDKVEDANAALDRLYAMGISFLDRSTTIGREGILSWGEAIKAQKQIVKFGNDMTGEAVFGLNLARNSLDKSLSKYIKSLEAFEPLSMDNPMRWVIGGLRKLAAWWRTAAVSGIAPFINVARPFVDYMGDYAQNAFSKGFGTANRIIFQNSISGLPKVGPIFQDFASRTVKGTKNPRLRSLLETGMNPHIDDFWRGREGVLRIGEGGPLVTYDYLRQRSITDGIWDTQVGSDVLDFARRLIEEDPSLKKFFDEGGTLESLFGLPGKVAGKVVDLQRSGQDLINQWIQTTQQRQRVGTWLIHLSDGKSFDEAARLTREALYDWKHGISQTELFYQFRALPFIRWARLTSSQLLRGITGDLTRPNLEVFSNALMGQTAINRLRVMYRVQRGVIPYMLDSRSPEEIADEDGFIHGVARGLPPWWVKESLAPYAGSWAQDHNNMDQNYKLFGDEHKNTHWAGVLPPNGLIDMLNVWSGVASMFVSVYLRLVNEDIAADDLQAKGITQITGLMYPAARDYIESVAGIQQIKGGGLGQPQPISSSQAYILKKTGVEISQDPDTGQHYTTTTTADLITKLPWVALGAGRLVNDWKFRNPGAGKDISEQMKWFALNQTRLMRTYPYNVYDEHERLQKKISEKTKLIEKRYKFDKN